MRLEHQFSVPAPPDVVWAAVIDPERVAPCMPGATLTAVDGAGFSGSVKVKLGPVSLMYKGTGEFLETDEQARKVVIKASGKDSRGNGTAAATVTVTLAEEGTGTKGTVVTDLTVTGKPAQFGRGMIVEVGGKILDTFASCLAGKLDGAGDATPATPEKPAKTTSEAAPKAKAAAEPKAAPEAKAGAAPEAAASEPKAEAPAEDEDGGDEAPPQVKPKPARRRTAAKAKPSTTVSAEVTDGAVAPDLPPSSPLDTEVTAAPRLQLVDKQEEPAESKPAARQVNVSSDAEAIDLLDYAGPSVAKRAVPVVIGLLVLFILLRRLRHRS